jgi:N-methylhydantoinase B/oxoprolinase/acetone carboxylase alpha subunit
MAGPRYTIAQTRARVAAMEIAANHLETCVERDELDYKQFADVALKLRNEATRLKAKAQETRNGK